MSEETVKSAGGPGGGPFLPNGGTDGDKLCLADGHAPPAATGGRHREERCPSCGAAAVEDARYCPHCGTGFAGALRPPLGGHVRTIVATGLLVVAAVMTGVGAGPARQACLSADAGGSPHISLAAPEYPPGEDDTRGDPLEEHRTWDTPGISGATATSPTPGLNDPYGSLGNQGPEPVGTGTASAKVAAVSNVGPVAPGSQPPPGAVTVGRASAAGSLPPLPPCPSRGDRATANELVREGRSLKEAGLIEDSVRTYEAAVATDPSSPRALGGLAYMYLRTGRPGEAVPRLLTAMACDEPTVTTHLRSLGDAYVQLGQDALALAAYDRALELDAANVAVILRKGGLQWMLGDHDGARATWQVACDQRSRAACQRIERGLSVRPGLDWRFGWGTGSSVVGLGPPPRGGKRADR